MTTPDKPFLETADIETASDGYAARFAGATGQWFLDVQERVTRDLIGTTAPARTLDVGGGHGQLAVPLVEAGLHVTVTGSAESCRRRLEPVLDSDRCEFVVADHLNLPFDDNAFDLVLCFRLLTHCERWQQLAAEMSRVARKAIIVDYPTSQGVNRIAPSLFKAKRSLEGNTRTWISFRHAELASAFADHGFTLDRRVGQFFLPMVLHRMLRCRPLSVALEGVCAAAGLTRRWGSPVIARMTPTGGERKP